MAKTATETVSKAATKAVNNKTRVKADKPKREPSAYQIFCRVNMKKWNEENPGRAKEAMTQIALLWKDAPENPNRGKETSRTRKPKAKEPKASKEPKTKTKAKPRAKKAKKAEVEDEDEDEDEDVENCDPVEAGNDDED